MATIIGNARDNTLNGSPEDDVIQGLGGSDWIMADAGNDRLNGGPGRDILLGGDGTDTYVYQAVADSPRLGPDMIGDFSGVIGGDRDAIRLTAIDADARTPFVNDDFRASQLSYTVNNIGDAVLTADVINGPDLQIILMGGPSVDLIADIIG
jgi:Ca2+-binding RTX toxin-like protein